MNRRWTGLVIILGMVAFTVAVWGSLPERIPTHWNIRGEADGWSSRTTGALLMPAIASALWLVVPVLRRIDPRRTHYERFGDTFWLLINILLLFMGAVHVLTLGTGLGWEVDVTRWMLVMLGLMLILFGNYLPRVRSNWWVGIRTPWTLESESVWRQTHRFAGTTFVLGGLVAILAAMLPSPVSFFVGMTAVMVGALIPTVYSYIVYRREQSNS